MAKDRMDVLELLRAHVQGAVVCRIPAQPLQYRSLSSPLPNRHALVGPSLEQTAVCE